MNQAANGAMKSNLFQAKGQTVLLCCLTDEFGGVMMVVEGCSRHDGLGDLVVMNSLAGLPTERIAYSTSHGSARRSP